MTRPLVRIHNVTTDEIIDREMNDVEFAEFQVEELKKQAQQAEAAAKESARQALLSKLGITQEEAQLLLGGK
jgi:hypothetical protein